MKILPANATDKDPEWTSEIHKLAYDMVYEGLRAKTVARFTGLAKTRISEIHWSIHGKPPAGGPTKQGSPQYFVNGCGSSHFSGTQWNVQGTIFLSCYEKLLRAAGGKSREINGGWLLLHAYRAYRVLTEPHAGISQTNRLDINQAYALISFTAISSIPEVADIALQPCPRCKIEFLINRHLEMDFQKCPVCSIAANHERLATIATHQRRKEAILKVG